MDAWWARALAVPWGAMNESVGSPMRCDERVWGEATSMLVLEVLAVRGKVRSPPSVDGGVVQQGRWRLAGDGGAVGAGVGSLPAMGVEEVAVECTANLERRCGSACLHCHTGSRPPCQWVC